MSLVGKLTAFVQAVGADIKSLTSRSLPSGGTTGQVLVKSSATNYATQWATPSGQAITTQDAAINGLLVATDRLNDINTDGQMTLTSQQPYFHQVVSPYNVTVGGVAVWLKFTGYQTNTNYNNAVALYDLAGNRLAVGNASAQFRDNSGWQRIAFENSVTLVAGSKYVLGVIIDGNSPGFGRVNGFSEINALIPASGLPRTFRKLGVANFSGASLDFTPSNVSSSTGDRLFMALVA